MQLTLRSVVVLQNYKELFKSCFRVRKKFDNIFHFKTSSRVLKAAP